MASRSRFESLPPELTFHILSYLVYPRSRHDGYTEEQSAHDYPAAARVVVRAARVSDLTRAPEGERYAADIFSFAKLRHPFNTLALTSKYLHTAVESYSGHLVKSCNRFNLPLQQFEASGAHSVYPDLSAIVYRRLWLQTAPRLCVFCRAGLSNYPHEDVPVIATCQDCFYAQTLTMQEIEEQYHMTRTQLRDHNVRGSWPNLFWILRIDAEVLALQLYGTKAFHDLLKHDPNNLKKTCSICAQASRVPGQKLKQRPRSQREYARLRQRRDGTLLGV